MHLHAETFDERLADGKSDCQAARHYSRAFRSPERFRAKYLCSLPSLCERGSYPLPDHSERSILEPKIHFKLKPGGSIGGAQLSCDFSTRYARPRILRTSIVKQSLSLLIRSERDRQ